MCDGACTQVIVDTAVILINLSSVRLIIACGKHAIYLYLPLALLNPTVLLSELCQ